MNRLIRLLTIIATCFVVSCDKEQNGWNSLTAQTEELKVGPGPEDILIDNFDGNNRLLASCSQRREGADSFGEIVAVDLTNNQISVLTRKGEPAGMPFNPHGFYIQQVNGETLLYVINHYYDEENTNAITVFKVSGMELMFVKEYKNSLMISPNDLCVLPDGSFYFSNDMGSDDLIYEQLINKFGGSIVHCTKDGICKMVDEKLAFPNGLEFKDNQLYVATTRQNALFRYTIQSDGSLSARTRINAINGMDNLIWYGNELLVSVHPDEIAFVAHSTNKNALSPSYVYAINAETGESRMVFQDNGKRISAGSTSVIVNNKLYIAQVFEDFLLEVDLSD